MADYFTKNYKGYDPDVIVQIVSQRQGEADKKDPIKKLGEIRKEESNMDKYLDESKRLYLEEGRETVETLAVSDCGICDEDTKIATEVALNHIKMASEIQKIEESRSREKGDMLAIGCGALGAFAALITEGILHTGGLSNLATSIGDKFKNIKRR